MAILLELSTKKGIIWRDTVDVTFVDSPAVIFQDGLGSGTRYLSLDGEALDHYWDAYVESFVSPQYQTATDYGGFVRMGFGEMSVSLDAFEDDGLPPRQLTMTAKYTDSTESAAVELFTGDIYLKSYNTTTASYLLNDPKYTQDLLVLGPDYDGNTVPYPKAFGIVTHVEPLRVADNAGRPTYHLAGISTSSSAISISAFSSAATGTKTKVYTSAPHGWSTPATIDVYVAGTVNFDGIHRIESASGSEFVIPVAYPTTNSERLPIHASTFILGDFAVFDDGVPIQTKVGLNLADGTFSLSSQPVGAVTVCGTGEDSTLEDIVSWGQVRLDGIISMVSTNARAVSPAVSYWATSQMPLIDFMSDLCAFFTHYFYVKDDILTLGDMLLDNGTETVDEFEYLDVTYSENIPVSQVASKWTTHQAENGFVDEVRTARFIKEVQRTVVKSIHTISDGTTDGEEAFRLIKTTGTFLTEGVQEGHVAQNTTDGTSTVVLAATETSLTLKDDIFATGEDYIVGPSYPYGQKIEVEPFHDNESNVLEALTNILAILNKSIAEIKMPITSVLPSPGQRMTFTDTQLIRDMLTYVRARTLSFDFNNEEIVITGEGVIS